MANRSKDMDMVYGFKELVNDLEPYSLYPRSEISKLLRYTFQLILMNMKLNKKAMIPGFGEFMALFKSRGAVGRHPLTGQKIQSEDRFVAHFKPYPYVRWFLTPNQLSGKYEFRRKTYEDKLKRVQEDFFLSPKYNSVDFEAIEMKPSWDYKGRRLFFSAKPANKKYTSKWTIAKLSKYL